jgi:hypothetical protein
LANAFGVYLAIKVNAFGVYLAIKVNPFGVGAHSNSC